MKQLKNLLGMGTFYKTPQELIDDELHSASLTCIVEELRLHEEVPLGKGLSRLRKHEEHIDEWVNDVLVLQQIK